MINTCTHELIQFISHIHSSQTVNITRLSIAYYFPDVLKIWTLDCLNDLFPGLDCIHSLLCGVGVFSLLKTLRLPKIANHHFLGNLVDCYLIGNYYTSPHFYTESHIAHTKGNEGEWIWSWIHIFHLTSRTLPQGVTLSSRATRSIVLILVSFPPHWWWMLYHAIFPDWKSDRSTPLTIGMIDT